jgi:hypothetical protein
MKFKDKFRAMLKPLILFLSIVIILTLGFINNSWGTVGKKWFIDWRMVKDAPFIGRLVQSKQGGILSYAGLLGWGDRSKFDNDWELVLHQYDVYLASGSFNLDSFDTYNSAIGAQGVVFSIFDSLLPHLPEKRLYYYQSVTALMTAVTLGLIVVWVYLEFGLVAAVFSAGFMILSEWVTLFGGSIYWSLWAMYLPFVAVAYFARKGQFVLDGRLLLIVYITVFVKCMFNGFEYITTVLLMIFVPLVYYMLVSRVQFKKTITAFVSVFLAEFFAVISSLVVLMIQNTIVLGGVSNAVNYILFSLRKRSIGNPENFSGDPALVESLRANTFKVLEQYVFGRAVKLNLSFISDRIPDWHFKELEVNYPYVFIFFLIATILYLVLQLTCSAENKKLSSFLIVTWLSVLAPLSWFILFKAHSYLHLHLNFIVWQMPFTLLGFGMCGAVFEFLVAWIFRKRV